MRPSASNYVHLEDVEIVRETDAAFLILVDGEWIADQKGIE